MTSYQFEVWKRRRDRREREREEYKENIAKILDQIPMPEG